MLVLQVQLLLLQLVVVRLLLLLERREMGRHVLLLLLWRETWRQGWHWRHAHAWRWLRRLRRLLLRRLWLRWQLLRRLRLLRWQTGRRWPRRRRRWFRARWRRRALQNFQKRVLQVTQVCESFLLTAPATASSATAAKGYLAILVTSFVHGGRAKGFSVHFAILIVVVIWASQHASLLFSHKKNPSQTR